MDLGAQITKVLIGKAQLAPEIMRTSPADAPPPGTMLVRGKITAVTTLPDGGYVYDVDRLDALGASARTSYESVEAFPPGEAFAENAYVILAFDPQRERPYIMATGSGGGGGSVTVMTAESNTGFLAP